mmetsp:Transcript_24341/g.61545  ORF Transcript_24341/g.61545 Transcript_24341/m.61545 type:complete len:225 (-) Transcript_24341:281-955(-)
MCNGLGYSDSDLGGGWCGQQATSLLGERCRSPRARQFARPQDRDRAGQDGHDHGRQTSGGRHSDLGRLRGPRRRSGGQRRRQWRRRRRWRRRRGLAAGAGAQHGALGCRRGGLGVGAMRRDRLEPAGGRGSLHLGVGSDRWDQGLSARRAVLCRPGPLGWRVAGVGRLGLPQRPQRLRPLILRRPGRWRLRRDTAALRRRLRGGLFPGDRDSCQQPCSDGGSDP